MVFSRLQPRPPYSPWLAKNEGTDPCSSPYANHYSSYHFVLSRDLQVNVSREDEPELVVMMIGVEGLGCIDKTQ